MVTKKSTLKKTTDSESSQSAVDRFGPILKATIRLSADKVYDLDFREELRADVANLPKELLDQPSKFAWFATLYRLSQGLESRVKAKLDKLEADLDLKFRNNPPDGLKVTETVIKNLVIQTEAYQKTLEEYNRVREQTALLSDWREALAERKDMLQSARASLGQEFEQA